MSLTLRTRSSKKQSRMLASWKRQWLPLCFARQARTFEASESTKLRMEELLPNHHEDHIAGKGENSLQHYNLVHKFIPMPQVVKFPEAGAAVDKGWENWKRFRESQKYAVRSWGLSLGV